MEMADEVPIDVEGTRNSGEGRNVGEQKDELSTEKGKNEEQTGKKVWQFKLARRPKLSEGLSLPFDLQPKACWLLLVTRHDLQQC